MTTTKTTTTTTILMGFDTIEINLVLVYYLNLYLELSWAISGYQSLIWANPAKFDYLGLSHTILI